MQSCRSGMVGSADTQKGKRIVFLCTATFTSHNSNCLYPVLRYGTDGIPVMQHNCCVPHLLLESWVE